MSTGNPSHRPRSKQASNEEIARAARDGAGIDAAVKRAVENEVEMRRKLGYPIVTLESMEKNGKAD